MHCNNCGEYLNEDIIFCPMCGVRQTEDQIESIEKSARLSNFADKFSIYQYEPLWDYWRIKGLIGSGAYGKVYLAYREEFGRIFYSAIKHITIPQHDVQMVDLYAEGLVDDETSVQEYYSGVLNNILNEVNTNYELKGLPNIVLYEDHTVIERPGAQGYDVFIKMELLTSLNKLLRNQSFSERETARLGIDICTALETLNSKKIIHRDIKPANIFVDAEGTYKLGDFGIARHMEKTMSSMSVKGTFAYMPPEIQKGEKVDRRADVYSLGLVMYKLLNANRVPFLPLPPDKIKVDDNNRAIERRMKGERLPGPQHAGAEMSRIILKACSYNKENRWQDASTLKQALEKYLVSVEPAESGKLAAANESENIQNVSQGNKAVVDNGANGGGNNETVDDILDRVLGKGQRSVQVQQFKKSADQQAPRIYENDTVQLKNENLTDTVGLFPQKQKKEFADAGQKQGKSSFGDGENSINNNCYVFPEKNAENSDNKIINLKPIVLILSLLVFTLGVLNAFQLYGDNSQIIKLNNIVDARNSTISSIQSKVTDLQNNVTRMQNKVEFMDDYIVVVSDDGTGQYHKYGCEDLDTSNFWAYNEEAAISKGYSACPKCCDND